MKAAIAGNLCEEYVTNDGDFGIDFTISQSTQGSALDYDGIVVETEAQFSLNPKQSKVFRLITNDVVKRLKHEQVEQIIAYVGGPGGTEESQVIKAIISFHEKDKLRHTLHLCAYTGTASKLIGGSTISSIGMMRNCNVGKLEKIWSCVNTCLLDEGCMVGCRMFAELSKHVTIAKHT